MGRYLTPSKVTLLILIYLFDQGYVPETEKTGVLYFLMKHISPDLGKATTELQGFSTTLPIAQFEAQLSKRASALHDYSLWELLVRSLWSIDCLAALDQYIEYVLGMANDPATHMRCEIESHASSGNIAMTSPLGTFIRRCHYEYTRLHFRDNIAVLQDLITYRHQTLATYEKKNNLKGRTMLDINLSELSIDVSHPLARIMFDRLAQPDNQQRIGYSTQEVEKLLEFQLSEMQRLGGRVPENMQIQLRRMSEGGAAVPKLAYYLKFLDSWCAGDYSSAFDNLHRYFDYTMRSRERTFYQYGLLNLAVLQAEFGSHAEAILAIQEAMATARGNGDTVCLNFCLSWLYHFGRSFPAQIKNLREKGILVSEIEGLAFLKSRAKDAEMWSLFSTCILTEAKLGLQQGISVALVFEDIVKASHINNVKAVQDATGPPLLMKGSVFDRIGQSHMAETCANIFLLFYDREAPIEDVLKCRCRLASSLVQQGEYADAKSMMASVPNHILRALKNQIYWTYHSDLFKLRRHLCRGDLDVAGQMVQRLKRQGPPDVDSDFSLGFLEIDLYIRQGYLEDALRVIGELADRVQTENNDVMIKSKLMILKARLWAKSGHSMKGFSLTMRAAGLAYRAQLFPTLWEAIGALANILLERQEFGAARNLLKAIIPRVRECRDRELAARTYSLLADAYVGMAGLEEAKSNRRDEYLSKALGHIGAALEEFQTTEDSSGQLEMLSKAAKIQYVRGDLNQADHTSSLYLQRWKHVLYQ